MPTTLTTPAIEQSTYAIVASFNDETGAAVVPNAGLTWTLTDADGNVINGRAAVEIAPAVSVTIVLHGADLALSSSRGRRVLTIEGTYNSDLGNDLEIKDEVVFDISNLTAVT